MEHTKNKKDMKKLLIVFGFLMLASAGFGQIIAPKGIYIGRGVTPVSGTNITKIDSLTLVSNQWKLYNGATSYPFVGVDTTIHFNATYGLYRNVGLTSKEFYVYDVNKDDTFETVKKWKYDLDSKLIAYSNRKIPIILLANKIDIRNDNVNLDDYCKENNIDAWFATSAKENIGISDSIQKLISIIYEHKDEIIETPRTNIIKMKKQENNDCCYY